MEINMAQIDGPSYPIDTQGKLQTAKDKLFAYGPALIGKSWRVEDTLVTEINSNWLQGQKATLTLVQARKIAIEDWRAKLKAAIARVEQELKDGV